MINAAQTQPPRREADHLVNAGETVAPGDAGLGARGMHGDAYGQVPDAAEPRRGDILPHGFVIDSPVSDQGRQSTVYRVRKTGSEGSDYIVKLYHAGWRPSPQVRDFLMNVSHPHVAGVIDSGDWRKRYYEVYEYYSEGSLENVGALSPEHIRQVLVPAINEGLHELHSHGIVHCDIKPGNIYYTAGRKSVVIGDCGISGYANANGKLVDEMRGTPEYAPRVKSLLWSAALSPAYDYGSFGLVLCRAMLGRSLFEGMTIQQIARAWENGLELPSAIRGRLGTLIRGLLEDDEEKRWGYEQVKLWCKGEYLSAASSARNRAARKKQQTKPLLFGMFNGEPLSVTTLHQLALAIRAHWEQARRVVRRRDLFEFVRQFDEDKAVRIRALSRCTDDDAAVYQLLVYVDDTPWRIFYCGTDYGTLPEYVDSLATGTDPAARRFLMSGMLVFYLRFNGYDAGKVDELESVVRHGKTGDMATILTLCYALKGEKAYDAFGTPVETLDDLVPVLARRSLPEIDALLDDERFIAWLNRLGYGKEAHDMQKAGQQS